MYNSLIKPLLDILIALLLLFILAPVFLISLLLLIFVNEGKPFFFQIRPGKNAVNFKVIKFKTMSDKKDARGNLLPDELRLHRLGKFIRKSSIDEMPQLINVIKGDMSLVGPRPLLQAYVPLYTKEQYRRHEVKPGISGWAQINGRNAISWEEKFKLDVWYVDNQSFWLDFKIVLLTIKKVLLKEDINTAGQATTLPFTGTKS